MAKRMLHKQLLTAMEGKHHDAKPRYTRKPKCERCRDTGWINTSPTKAWPDPVPCGCQE